MDRKKQYSNGEITVVWQPNICIHSGMCFRGLPRVFQPRVRPWIKLEAASTEDIVNQVTACPSGALSYYRNDSLSDDEKQPIETKIEVLKDGPLVVHGLLKVMHNDGKEEIKINKTAFCRCGDSNNKPFCDGSHNKNGFKG